MKNKNQTPRTIDLPTSFTFHHDPGQGWLEVPYQTILQLELEDEISGFSHHQGEIVYLEADGDAPHFINYYLQAVGRLDYDYFKSLCKNQYYEAFSPIRNYPRFKKSYRQ